MKKISGVLGKTLVIISYTALLPVAVLIFITASIFWGMGDAWIYVPMMVAVYWIHCGLWIFLIEKWNRFQIFADVINCLRNVFTVISAIFVAAFFNKFDMFGTPLYFAMLGAFPQIVYLVAKADRPKKFYWIFTAIFGVLALALIGRILYTTANHEPFYLFDPFRNLLS